MKRISAIPVVISLGLTACETMNTPMSGGNFDPLQTPGGSESQMRVADSGGFSAGEFVLSIMDNTAFFNQRPKGDADADKLLPRATSMKVISSGESYVKVELDSGEVGWVPNVMIESANASSSQGGSFVAPNPGEYQVYPPVDGYGGDLPSLPPGAVPSDGVIPTIIDPDASGASGSVSPATEPKENFAVPAAGETPPETPPQTPPEAPAE